MKGAIGLQTLPRRLYAQPQLSWILIDFCWFERFILLVFIGSSVQTRSIARPIAGSCSTHVFSDNLA